MKGVGAGTRVFDLLDRKSAIPLSVGKTLEPGREGPIRFENVSFTYPSRKEVEVLKGVDLQIEPGTSLAIAYVIYAPAGICRVVANLTFVLVISFPKWPEWKWEIQHPSLDLPVLRPQQRSSHVRRRGHPRVHPRIMEGTNRGRLAGPYVVVSMSTARRKSISSSTLHC
jgi:hypothetical protein